MNLKDVYEMPVFRDTEYTKLTPHDNCVWATILYISRPIPRGKWWKQTITVCDETCHTENVHFRTEYPEALLVRGRDEGKGAIWRLQAYKGEFAEFLSGYPKELLEDKEQEQ